MASFHKWLVIAANKNKLIRKIARKIIRAYWKIRFKAFDITIKTDDRTILFKAYKGQRYSCSPRAIYEEMLGEERFFDYHFIWIFQKPDQFRYLEKNRNTKVVAFGSNAYYQAYARSKFWIVNCRTRMSLTPGRKHCLVQTWHGTPLKRLGLDIMVEGSNSISAAEMKADYRNEGKRVTYFLSPSVFYTEKIASAFGLSKEKRNKCFIEKGYPRNDQLFRMNQEDQIRIKNQLAIPADKKVILYAPTFRDNQHTDSGCAFSLGFELNHFCKTFGETHVLLFRTHYFITEQMDLSPWQGIVFDVSKWDNINELYIISDMLITDYSSVFFDYANLKRPILFFMYDLEEYRDRIRDFYLDLKELPGDIVITEEELYQAIGGLDGKDAYDRRYQKFHQRFNYLDGPHTAKHVLEALIPPGK